MAVNDKMIVLQFYLDMIEWDNLAQNVHNKNQKDFGSVTVYNS